MVLYVGENKVEKVYQGVAPVDKIMQGEFEMPVYNGEVISKEFVQTANYIADGVSYNVELIPGQELASDALTDVGFENVYKAGFEGVPSTNYYNMTIRPYNAHVRINVPLNNLSVKINLSFANYPVGSPTTSLHGTGVFWGLYNNDELVLKQSLSTVKKYVLNPENKEWNNIRFSAEKSSVCAYTINMLKIWGG